MVGGPCPLASSRLFGIRCYPTSRLSDRRGRESPLQLPNRLEQLIERLQHEQDRLEVVDLKGLGQHLVEVKGPPITILTEGVGGIPVGGDQSAAVDPDALGLLPAAQEPLWAGVGPLPQRPAAE